LLRSRSHSGALVFFRAYYLLSFAVGYGIKAADRNQLGIVFVLKIDQAGLAEICRHAEQAYPHECCGVLLGHFDGQVRRVTAVVSCRNTREDSPQNRYHIDPRELIRVQREGRTRGMDIVGFYHSHPDHPSAWSPTDLTEAHWFGCSYVITSVVQGKAGATSSFELAGSDEYDKTFVEEEIEVS